MQYGIIFKIKKTMRNNYLLPCLKNFFVLDCIIRKLELKINILRSFVNVLNILKQL